MSTSSFPTFFRVFSVFRALNIPHTLTLVRRETTANLRSWKIFFAVSILVLGVGLLVINNLPTEFDYMYSGVYSQLLLMYYVVYLGALGSVLIPILAAVSFGTEIQNRTFELLRMSPYTPGQMLTAKVASFIILYLLASLIYMPIIGVLFFYIGVEYSELLMAFLTCSSYMLLGLSLGVYASVSQLHPLKAISRTIGLAIIYYIFFTVAFYAIMGIVMAAFTSNSGANLFMYSFLMHPLASIAFSLLILYMTQRLLRKKIASDQMLWIQNDEDTMQITSQVFYRDKLEKKSGAAQKRVFKNRWQLGLVIVLLVSIMWIFLYTNALVGEGMLSWIEVITATLCTLGAFNLAVMTAKDRVAGTLDMLRMTLLRPYQILFLRLFESLREQRLLIALGAFFIAIPMLYTAYQGHFEMRAALILLCAPLALIQSLLLAQLGALFARQYATAIVFALVSLSLGMGLFMYLCVEAISFFNQKVVYNGDEMLVFFYFARQSGDFTLYYFFLINAVRLVFFLVLIPLNITLYAAFHHAWRPQCILTAKGKSL